MGRIINPKAMATPRSHTCEWCGRTCWNPTQRHHIHPKGMAAASQIDHPFNLIDLGGPWDCNHHQEADDNKIKRAALWLRVSVREGKSVEELMDFIYRVLRAEKGSVIS